METAADAKGHLGVHPLPQDVGQEVAHGRLPQWIVRQRSYRLADGLLEHLGDEGLLPLPFEGHGRVWPEALVQ